MGASTVLAVQRNWPNEKVVWFEGTHSITASKDINKIIRTHYPDDDYILFAERAMNSWKTRDPYRKHFHQCSWVQVVKEGSHRSTMRGPNDKKISTEDLLRNVGSHESPKLGSDEELWLNENVGYADSHLAIESVAEEAASLGVVREKTNVSKLIIREGVCRGVEIDSGTVIAEKIIVATGPWTPGLLEKSGVWFPDNFFTVAAVPVATVSLGDSDSNQLKSMPILVTENGTVTVQIFWRPLTPDRRSYAFSGA